MASARAGTKDVNMNKNLFCETQSGSRDTQVKKPDWWEGKKRYNNPKELRVRDELAHTGSETSWHAVCREMREPFSIGLLGPRDCKYK